MESGTYRVSRSKLENEILTTPGDWAVSVANGQSQDLVFGSYETEAAEVAELPAEAAADESAATTAGAVSEAEDAEDGGGMATGLVIVVVVIAVLLLAAIVVAVLSARRPS